MGKIGGVYLAAAWLGYDRAGALGTGIGLNARGTIEIVIATVGLEHGISNSRMDAVVLVVAVVTSAMTPPLLRRVLGGNSGHPDPEGTWIDPGDRETGLRIGLISLRPCSRIPSRG